MKEVHENLYPDKLYCYDGRLVPPEKAKTSENKK